MDLHPVTSDDDELEQQQTDGRRYRARMVSDVVLMDLDWDEEPASESEAAERPALLKMRSA
jgi:hypothetical protein